MRRASSQRAAWRGPRECPYPQGEDDITIFNRPDNRDVELVQRKSVEHFHGLLIAAAAISVLVLLVVFLLRVTRIEAGHVGVEMNLAGSQRDASEMPVRTGWVVYSPLRTQIIEFPTYVQTVKWTRDTAEGHPVNEEMGFNFKEGMEILVDVSLSYAIDPMVGSFTGDNF
jgi:hypothetical protein